MPNQGGPLPASWIWVRIIPPVGPVEPSLSNVAAREPNGKSARKKEERARKEPSIHLHSRRGFQGNPLPKVRSVDAREFDVSRAKCARYRLTDLARVELCESDRVLFNLVEMRRAGRRPIDLAPEDLLTLSRLIEWTSSLPCGRSRLIERQKKRPPPDALFGARVRISRIEPPIGLGMKTSRIERASDGLKT